MGQLVASHSSSVGEETCEKEKQIAKKWRKALCAIVANNELGESLLKKKKRGAVCHPFFSFYLGALFIAVLFGGQFDPSLFAH